MRRLDEDLPALLQVGDRVGRGDARPVGHQGAGRARRDRAVPRLPAGEQVVHDAGAPRVGQKLRAEADEPARGNPELHAHAAAAVVHHLRHRALAAADLRDDHALKILRHVDDEVLDRLDPLAVRPPW